MYAAVHARKAGSPEDLLALAALFSPSVERASPWTVVFSIAGLRRLIGGPNEIASAISRRGMEFGIEGNLAVAANPDTALLAARHVTGVSLIPPGQEAEFLSRLPIAALTDAPEVQATFARWGIATAGELAALPPIGLVERLGAEADRLRQLALGVVDRPLEVAPAAEDYRAQCEWEHPLARVEPILLAIAPLLRELAGRLDRQTLAASEMRLRFRLTRDREETRPFSLPLPTRDVAVLLKLIQLDLEAHPLGGAVRAIEVELTPVAPRTVQGGLFVPQGPEPDRLQNVLARLGALVGEDRVGSPELLDTHRPDAFRVRPYRLAPPRDVGEMPDTLPLKLSLRMFRPALPARVELRQERPAWVSAARLEGHIRTAAGPWRSSGEWWAETAFGRDEWDVLLQEGGLYRLSLRYEERKWFVEGMYD